MLVFLDTEFTDSLDCDLISIGMVTEDGLLELYEERADYRAEWCNQFVHAAVLPQLGKASPALDRAQLSTRLGEWFATLPQPVTVACDSFMDWELLLDALDGVCPANLTGRCALRSLSDSAAFHHAVVSYHEQTGPWHHALHDARAHRQGWLASQQNGLA
ncbi:3'-5' exoribonuclease [Duganella sp. HH101]|uniref:3'-5' exoribonuclease n=1 Tax=Duganella sp. HH101 TaxID=1781066 RepID=UPI0008FCD973|nr:3'-5' exoribonuclease [Duganella sp. HH101]